MNVLSYCQEFDIFLLSIVSGLPKGPDTQAISIVERQRRCHAKLHDLVHAIIKSNIEGCIILLHIFGKEVIS